MPNSRFALHGLAPPYFTVCALFLPLIHGLCAFLRPLLTPVSTAPFFASLSVHGLHFTLHALSRCHHLGGNFACPYEHLAPHPHHLQTPLGPYAAEAVHPSPPPHLLTKFPLCFLIERDPPP